MYFFLSFSVYADEKQWSAGGDGASWEDGSNWSSQTVPTTSDDAVIDIGDASVVASKTFYAKSLTVGGRKESSFSSADFIYGYIVPSKNTDNALYIRKDGTAILSGLGDIVLGGSFKSSDESLMTEPAFIFVAD